ncbi:MAG: hypothetical protein AB1898_28065 [Acidobacteriota bacterium]
MISVDCSTVGRWLRVSVALLLALQIGLSPLWAQVTETSAQPGPKLKIVILEGEGAINNIRQRTAREPIVQVEDENNRPVAGAMVLFTLPDRGPSATFPDGSKTLITYTDEKGQAKAQGLKPNAVAGNYQILVSATAHGVKASAVINQTNMLVAAATAGGISAKLITILAIAGGAAAAGVVAATSGGGNNTPAPPAPTPTATISVGTPTVGGPN